MTKSKLLFECYCIVVVSIVLAISFIVIAILTFCSNTGGDMLIEQCKGVGETDV